MSGGKFPWTDESVALLKELYAQDATGSEIARTLSVRTGFPCTRNAVIGKRVRLGLKKTPDEVTASKAAAAFGSNAKRKPKTQPSRVGVTIFGRAPPLKPSDYISLVPEPDPKVIPIGQRCTILDLSEHTCRWPIGVPGKPDFFFCGGKPHEGLPYCGYHKRLAYQPGRAR
jgi:GcrA cell cycle regulator